MNILLAEFSLDAPKPIPTDAIASKKVICVFSIVCICIFSSAQEFYEFFTLSSLNLNKVSQQSLSSLSAVSQQSLRSLLAVS